MDRLPGPNRSRYRILALDVDGTLLDPDGTLRPRTAEAVARAARAGIRPILCTGRRYRRARPVAEELGLFAPLVCNSGAIVKDPVAHQTLWRADFDLALLSDILNIFQTHGEPPLSFTDRSPDEVDFLIDRDPVGRPLFDDYLSQNRHHAGIDPRWTERLGDRPHFHLCTIGTRERMMEFQSAIHAALDGRVRTFVQKSPRYAGTMCEVLRRDASKWSAILHLAELWDISPREICAVGDDANDVPMIEGAGLGVAMGHASADVLEVADHITADHDHDGVAVLVDEILLR
jgi:Cof subfamily protein (haloacid dehalogenase superfamily)